MTFIEAVILISQNKDFKLCDAKDELNGIRSCICVYYKNEFAGKLRWPIIGSNKKACVDLELQNKLHKLKRGNKK
jgi:hypothetical protein